MSTDTNAARAAEIVDACRLSSNLDDLERAITAALDEAEARGRVEERAAIWKSVMNRIEHNPGEIANAMRALSGWICRRSENDTQSSDTVSSARSAIIEVAMAWHRYAGGSGVMTDTYESKLYNACDRLEGLLDTPSPAAQPETVTPAREGEP